MYESAMKPWMNCLVSSLPPCTSRVDRALDHQVERAPHLADRVHAVVDAARAEAVLRGLVAGAGAAELVLDRHAHVVVDDLAVVARRGPTPATPRTMFTPGVFRGTMICVILSLRPAVSLGSVGAAHDDEEVGARSRST